MAYKFNPFTGNLDEVGTGGGGTPGGSDTQVQFNDGGALGGDAGLTYDDTNGSLSVGGKTVTASEPVLDLSQTWDNAATTFTGVKLNVTNTASAGGSNLLDLQVGGTSRVNITSGGLLRFTPAGVYDNVITFGVGTLRADGACGARSFAEQNGGFVAAYDYLRLNGIVSYFGFSNGNAIAKSADVRLYRDDAGILAQRNGANAQTYRLYNTYTDASNYERGFLQWNSNVLEIGSEGAGTGSEQPVRITAATLKLPNLPTYADNTAATSGGLVAGDVYKTATGELRITV